MPSQDEILIVGAGPVGLTMAAFLHHHGVKCRIIDKKSQPTSTSNAIIVHARTLELMRIIGIEQEFISQGLMVTKFNLISNQKYLANWDLKHIDSDFSYMLSISQKMTEQILINYLTNAGITIERNKELITIAEHDNYVEATIKVNEDEKETIQTPWVIGCDGYKSTMRELLDIEYVGEDLLLDFLILDVPLEGDISRDTGYAAFNEKMSVLLLPLSKSWRIIAEVFKEPKYHCGKNEMPSEETFQEILDVIMP